MKNKDLIKELQKYSEDLDVILCNLIDDIPYMYDEKITSVFLRVNEVLSKDKQICILLDRRREPIIQ